MSLSSSFLFKSERMDPPASLEESSGIEYLDST